MSGTILIVDDEEGIRFSLRGVLEDEGFTVLEAESGEAALRELEAVRPDLVFLDIWMTGMDGLAALDAVRKMDDSLPVVMISGHGTIETAVTAIKKGAFDFIEKPLSLEKVLLAANKALEVGDLRRENQALRGELGEQGRAGRARRRPEAAGLADAGGKDDGLTGVSPAIEELRALIRQLAPTDAWALITGESGAGKEVVATSIHALSRRADRPFIAVNCAAIPEELIESELFGHEKGAFTGAERMRVGKFELAHGGTLFLDEIGDMSLKTQAKILRILQEQSFERVGGGRTFKVDVRVVAATNKDLAEEIKAGRFREDLYYRLRVFPLEAPPLRNRREDAPLLAAEFIARLRAERGYGPLIFSPRAMAAMQAYDWPGNVRELRNVVERMLILYAGRADQQGAEMAAVVTSTVEPAMLPKEIREAAGVPDAPVPLAPPASAPPPDRQAETASGEVTIPSGPADFREARAAFEARFLEAKLAECQGSVSRLAEMVGLERSHLYRKLKGLGVQVSE